MGRRAGFTRAELLIIVGIILVISAIAIPGLLSSERAANERLASTSLKAISIAEADFRANDRDGNKVNDFWTADVKGLYTMTKAVPLVAGAAPNDQPIKLIELDVARADADGLNFGGAMENLPLKKFGTSAALKGYWYVAMISDQSEGAAKAVLYKTDTGGKPPMGKCHHEKKFGFTAFPDSSSAGKYTFYVNENNTIFRSEVTTPVRLGTAIPPGLDGVAPVCLHWPDDATLRNIGTKGDD